MDKPVFKPATGAGAAVFKAEKMREKMMDKKDEIGRLILEDGNLKAALALAGEDVEIAIRRALKVSEDADDEGRGAGGGCACSIDFGEIVTAAQNMTQEQVNMTIMIAALLKGIFDMPCTTDSLDFISM